MEIDHATPLRERSGIWALAIATGISQSGNTITFLAVPWFVLTTTGSASRTGLASAMFALAAISSGLTIGNFIDHVGHRRVSLIADTLSGTTVLIIPLLFLADWLTFWQLLLLIFLSAFFDTPGSTARSAMAPMLADLSRMPLERANSVLRVAHVSGDIIIGPVLFGVLVAATSPVNVLFFDAATFTASVLIVAALIRKPAVRTADTQSEGSSPETRIEAFLAGFRFAFHDRVIRVVQPVAAIYSFVISAYFGVMLPVYIDDKFGNAGYLAVLIATLGGGSLLGTVLYGYVGYRYSRYKTLLMTSALSAVAIWLFTTLTYFPSDLLALFVFGVAGGPFNPLMRTLIQKRTDERYLGRVLNAIFTQVAVMAPLGILISGIAIDAFGLWAVQVSAAILISLVPLWFAFAPWPRAAAPAFEE